MKSIWLRKTAKPDVINTTKLYSEHNMASRIQHPQAKGEDHKNAMEIHFSIRLSPPIKLQNLLPLPSERQLIGDSA